MPKIDDVGHSIMIASAAEQFDAAVKRNLKNFITIDSGRSGAIVRRSVLERYYDILVINAPLPDETGEELALDVAERSNASVLMVVPQEVYDDVLDHVTDAGVLVISKPIPKGRIDKAVRFLMAMQRRRLALEKKIRTAEEKMEELRLVSKAKLVLMEKKHMTEDEAHRFIGKEAMDNGVSRGRIAMQILED